MKSKIAFIKAIKASILTGALLFCATIKVSANDSLVISTYSVENDSAVLVKNDTSYAQPIVIDTTFIAKAPPIEIEKTDTMKLHKYRSPKKAGLYSAIIPGLGQAYNHKYWKIPIIYIGGGLLVYYCVDQYNYYQKYIKLFNEEKFKPNNQQNENNITLYGTNRDIARKNYERLLLFSGLVYVANVVDAVVDAYFADFDISNDLSLDVKPAIIYPEFTPGNFSYGVSFCFNF